MSDVRLVLRSESKSVAALALRTYDILHKIFEVDRRSSDKKKLQRRDLLSCALVSRAFCEPALRALWRDMSPLTPLWRLLVLLPKVFKPKLLDAILSERMYTHPARWSRFMWYARFVQELNISAYHLEDNHKELICALMEHNGGQSVFPSLRELSWSPSSYSDSSYFPLFTPQLRSVILDFSSAMEAGLSSQDEEPQCDAFLSQLRASSPRLAYLCVDACWERIGTSHSCIVSSFEHLTGLNLIATISFTSFRELATMPLMESLRIAYVKWDEPSQPAAPIHAPRLELISIGGNCFCLIQLFNALHAPILASASFHAICDNPDNALEADYVPCIEALATVGASSTMEVLCIGLDEDGGPSTVEYLHDLVDPLLVFPNIKRFSLSCPMVGLFPIGYDLESYADAWPKLQSFSLSQGYWFTPDEEEEEEDGMGITIPTPDVLESFQRKCPDLRELALPYLDLNVEVPWLHLPKDGSKHRLKRLSFGVRDLNFDPEEDPVPEIGLDDDEIDKWAQYVLTLFPKLDAEYSASECVLVPGWNKVLKRARDIRRRQKSASLGSAVGKSPRY